ncbi:MAG: NADPH-dependent F420 reductase [Actinomycetota bacterium]
MRYAVLGTGMVGRTIAAALVRTGHHATMGTRDPEVTRARTEPGNDGVVFADWSQENSNVPLVAYSVAAAGVDGVINATSGTSSLAALDAVGADHLAGKVIIDIANPLDFSAGMPPSLNPVNTDSLGEQIQHRFPNAHVVKTLNTMTAGVMVEPSRVPGTHTVFVSGDDAAAKRQVTELLSDFGWPVESVFDLGGIETARGTEMLLPVWLRTWQALGHADFNFHIQKAPAL